MKRTAYFKRLYELADEGYTHFHELDSYEKIGLVALFMESDIEHSSLMHPAMGCLEFMSEHDDTDRLVSLLIDYFKSTFKNETENRTDLLSAINKMALDYYKDLIQEDFEGEIEFHSYNEPKDVKFPFNGLMNEPTIKKVPHVRIHGQSDQFKKVSNQ